MTIMSTKRKVIVESEDSSGNSEDFESCDEEQEAKTDSDKESNASQNANADDRSCATDNPGWVDSIAKILKTNKPKGKKTLVLSKAKKLTDIHKAKSKDVGFEIEAKDGKIKLEEVAEETTDQNESGPVRKKRKELSSVRVKPNILEKDRERMLSKIATKGVVQLFNAVKKQQKDIDTKLKEAGPLEVKRDKVLKNFDKREFLNVLMGDKSKAIANSNTKNVSNDSKSIENEEPTWSVLRDDFMMGAKMKDWDKELEQESEIEQEIAFESE